MKIFSYIWAFVFFANNLIAQDYQVGNSYFSENEYAEYVHGNLPIIISAPHGGEKKPNSIPDRNCSGCVTQNDTNTQELANEVVDAIQNKLGCTPYVIINRLHRSKLDANREIIEAADGNADAENAWEYYHGQVMFARDEILEKFGKGLFIDLHGHGHDIQRLELGYLMSGNTLRDEDELEASGEESSINHLIETNISSSDFLELIRGPLSLGQIMENLGVPAVPSQADPFPFAGEAYFSGGYNTRTYGSKNGSTIDAVQVECHQEVRFNDDDRLEFADQLATGLIDFIETHYFEGFSEFDCIVSTKENSAINFDIYPNPSKNELFIELEGQNSFIKIYDQWGRCVLSNLSLNPDRKLDISNLIPGIYHVLLIDQNENLTQKAFVKN